MITISRLSSLFCLIKYCKNVPSSSTIKKEITDQKEELFITHRQLSALCQLSFALHFLISAKSKLGSEQQENSFQLSLVVKAKVAQLKRENI